MDIFEKARVLSESGRFDSCGPKKCEVNIKEGLGGVYYAKAEHKDCKIFKTLMDNSCSYDCKYCPNHLHSAKNKISYEPIELAKLFMHLHKTIAVNGLFLSSAINSDPNKSSQRMLEAIKIIRRQHNFRGYIHFKVLPGVSKDIIKEASEYSDRMSINIEAPNKDILNSLCSCKDFKIDILRRQAWIKNLDLSSGQTTQIMLTKHSTDKEVLRMTQWDYEAFNLKRVYFSGFKPVKGTELEHYPKEPKSRELHLYNIDYLVRNYNYDFKEFYEIMNDGMLPNIDPKLAIAKKEFNNRLDVNNATVSELIRVPGIGNKTAKKIIEQKGKIKSYSVLDKLGCRIELVKPFIKVNGLMQKRLNEYQ